MERPLIRPEDRRRVPDLYEVIKMDKGEVRWTGVRCTAKFIPAVERVIKPPYKLVPITFRYLLPGEASVAPIDCGKATSPDIS